jgi:hypothetical protein
MPNPTQSGAGTGIGQLTPLLELLSKLKAPNGGIQGLKPVTPDHAFEAVARMLMLILPIEIRIAGMIPKTYVAYDGDDDPLEPLITKATIFILRQQLGTERLAQIDPLLWEERIRLLTRALTGIKNLLAVQGPTG